MDLTKKHGKWMKRHNDHVKAIINIPWKHIVTLAIALKFLLFSWIPVYMHD